MAVDSPDLGAHRPSLVAAGRTVGERPNWSWGQGRDHSEVPGGQGRSWTGTGEGSE